MRVCSIPDCGERHEARGYCNRHYLRWRHSGDPLAPDMRGKHMTGRSKERSPSWLGEAISYASLHKRLERYLGPARLHACVECGDQAQDWAFDEPRGHSADLSRYSPMCRPCHTQKDRP